MHEKLILLISALSATLAIIASFALELSPALAALLGAVLVIPIPFLAMRQNAEHLRNQAINAANALTPCPQALLILDAEGSVLTFTQGLQSLAGLQITHGLQALQTLPTSWQSLIAELHREALEAGWASRQAWLENHSKPCLIDVSCLKQISRGGQTQVLFHWTLISTERSPDKQATDQSAEGLLARSRAFVQTLIDVIPQPVYVKRMEAGIGRYLLVNNAFCAHYHRSRDQLLGCSALDVFEPVRANRYIQEERAIVDGSGIFREEKGVDPANGQERYLIVSKQSCLSPEGDRVIVGTHFDVTPWRMAELELQKTLERERNLRERTQSFVQRIIDVIPYPVHVKDQQSRYLMANDAFVKERGCTRETLLGQNPVQIARLMGEQRQEARETEDKRALLSLQEDQSILAGNTLIKEENNFHSVTGEERFRTVFKCSCLDMEGQPAVVTAMFDITKWRIAERELQEALAREMNLRERTQEFMQRFIDVIPQPVYMKDADSRYLLVNEAFARELHRERSQIIGRSSFELAPTPEIAVDSAEEDAAVLAGAIIFKEKNDHPYPGAGQRDRIISKRMCLNVDGQPVVVGNHVDIGALRKVERELHAAMNREQARNLRMQAYLQRIIDVIPQEFYIKDAKGRILMVNRAFLIKRNLNSAAEAIGHTMDELTITMLNHDPAYRDKPEAVDEAMAYYKNRAALSLEEDQQVLAGRAVLKEEHRTLQINGEEHFFLIAKEACLDVDDQPVIVCANFDITALRLAERALLGTQAEPASE